MKDDPAKAARLAAALRENLRKRKAQAREAVGDGSDQTLRPDHPDEGPDEKSVT